MTVILPEFAARLKALRKGSHKTQLEMAEYLHCAARHYQSIEYGTINIPILTLVALADYFHVTTDYLLGRD